MICPAWPASVKPRPWQSAHRRLPCRSFMRILPVGAGRLGSLEGTRLLLEYCDLAEADKTPIRMVRGHSFSLIGVSGIAHLVELCSRCLTDGMSLVPAMWLATAFYTWAEDAACACAASHWPAGSSLHSLLGRWLCIAAQSARQVALHSCTVC